MSELGDSFREMRERKQAYRRTRHGAALKDSMKAYQLADESGIAVTINTEFHYSIERNDDKLRVEYYPSTGLCLLGTKRFYLDTLLDAVTFVKQQRKATP